MKPGGVNDTTGPDRLKIYLSKYELTHFKDKRSLADLLFEPLTDFLYNYNHWRHYYDITYVGTGTHYMNKVFLLRSDIGFKKDPDLKQPVQLDPDP